MAKERREYDRDRDVALAWYAAAFQRQDKLPSLEALLTRRTSTDTTAPSDPKDMLHMLSSRLGIPMRQTRLIRKDAA